MGISNSACSLSFAVSPSSFFSSLSSATTAATTLPPELLTKFIESWRNGDFKSKEKKDREKKKK